MSETKNNLYGTPVTTDPNVCTSCVLAEMLETGVMSGAVDAGHLGCSGTRIDPCRCGCEYSLQHQCKQCGRKGTKLDDTGQCIDRRDCSNEILRVAAQERADRVVAKAAAPTPRRSGSSGQKRPCTCGCGETTGGGLYRPGHDARHVSALVAAFRAGTTTAASARTALAHSEKLQAKFDKAVG